MLKKILFASDFSPLTARAEDYAFAVAQATKASVTILSAVEPIDDSETDDAVTKFLHNKQAIARTKADKVMQRFRDAGLECEVHIEVNRRWKAIVNHATAGAYDLVVLGAHKIRDGDKVYMGTTTHKVFFGADLPLMVVPPA